MSSSCHAFADVEVDGPPSPQPLRGSGVSPTEILVDDPVPRSFLDTIGELFGRRPSVALFPPVVYLAGAGPTPFKYPLKVEIERGEECGYCAFAPQIEVGGTGATWEAAVEDLAKTAWALYDEFSHAARLHTSARERLARLAVLFG